ncbi:MAG: hypothetical protein V4805_02315 [Pseudomonadota bacterium]
MVAIACEIDQRNPAAIDLIDSQMRLGKKCISAAIGLIIKAGGRLENGDDHR